MQNNIIIQRELAFAQDARRIKEEKDLEQLQQYFSMKQAFNRLTKNGRQLPGKFRLRFSSSKTLKSIDHFLSISSIDWETDCFIFDLSILIYDELHRRLPEAEKQREKEENRRSLEQFKQLHPELFAVNNQDDCRQD